MLRGITYNILFGKKVNQIIVWLETFTEPFDLICFQEFPIAKINELESFIKKYQYAYAYATSFIMRGKDYGELTMIRKPKLHLVDTTIVNLGKTLIETKILGAKGERSALITKIASGDKEFILANTHLAALALNGKRKAQINTILAHLERNKEVMPTIILGDFNYSSMVRQKQFVAYMEGRTFTNGHTTHTHKLIRLKMQQLDYIFYKNCAIKNIEVLKLKFSDHLPTLFEVHI